MARFYGPRCGNFSALFSEHTHGMLVETLKLTNHAENASPDGPLTLLTRTQAHRFRRWRCDLCLLLVFYHIIWQLKVMQNWSGWVGSRVSCYFFSDRVGSFHLWVGLVRVKKTGPTSYSVAPLVYVVILQRIWCLVFCVGAVERTDG